MKKAIAIALVSVFAILVAVFFAALNIAAWGEGLVLGAGISALTLMIIGAFGLEWILAQFH